MKPVFLLGMPGSGKSTLGRALAASLGRQFIDLDTYIEGRFSRTVADIFATMGEERFRQIEASLLREVAEMENVVVALGGGAPCHHGSMDYVLSRGDTVWLRASRARLHERLCRYRRKRPAVAALDDDAVWEYIDRLAAEREPVYARAAIAIDSSRLEDRSQIADTLKDLLPLIEKN